MYLADLRKLSLPFGGSNEQILACVFLEGLCIEVSRLLQASSKPCEISIDQLLARAQPILKESEYVVAAARMKEALSKLKENAASDFLIPRILRAPNATSVVVPITSESAEIKVMQGV